jgi:phytoene/squalene synthetase
MTMAWQLTESGFERLLRALDDDRDRAAVEYSRIRERLAGLLRWWGAANYDELADATLDRIIRTLEHGKPVPRQSFAAYARGVARMIYSRTHRSTRRRPCSIVWIGA